MPLLNLKLNGSYQANDLFKISQMGFAQQILGQKLWSFHYPLLYLLDNQQEVHCHRFSFSPPPSFFQLPL
jgi:hypothetical protein